MLDFTSRHPIDEIITGFVCTTEPEQSLIGRLVVPTFPVYGSAYSGQILRKSHIGKLGGPADTQRAIGAPIRATVFGSDPARVSYQTNPYAAKTDRFAPEEIDRSQTPYDLLEDEMDSVVQKLDIDDEIRIAAQLFGTSLWTAEPTLSSFSVSGGKWSTTATARPRSDLRKLRRTYEQQAHGRTLDTCVIGAEPFEAYCLSYEARGMLIVTSGAAAAKEPLKEDEGRAAIASDLGISPDRVFVGRGRKNTNSIVGSHTEADIWGDFMWVGNLLGATGVQQVGGVTKMKGKAIGLMNIDEMTLFRSAMGDVSAKVGRGFIGGFKQYDMIDGGGIEGWAQHYTTHSLLAADLGLLVQDLV